MLANGSSEMKIRPATIQDAVAYCAHQERHNLESGRDGNLIFSPFEKSRDDKYEDSPDQLTKKKKAIWTESVTEVGWERSWILTDERHIYGEVKLIHQPALISSLHRALLMMGIERAHRGQGYGLRLMETAIDWAKAQPSLEWIELHVFENNQPAKRLYEKMGFRTVGTVEDCFRVFNRKITDVTMLLKLRE